MLMRSYSTTECIAGTYSWDSFAAGTPLSLETRRARTRHSRLLFWVSNTTTFSRSQAQLLQTPAWAKWAACSWTDRSVVSRTVGCTAQQRRSHAALAQQHGSVAAPDLVHYPLQERACSGPVVGCTAAAAGRNAAQTRRWRSSTALSLRLTSSTTHCRPSRRPSPDRADTSCTRNVTYAKTGTAR